MHADHVTFVNPITGESRTIRVVGGGVNAPAPTSASRTVTVVFREADGPAQDDVRSHLAEQARKRAERPKQLSD
jgi:hypothetical protein